MSSTRVKIRKMWSMNSIRRLYCSTIDRSYSTALGLAEQTNLLDDDDAETIERRDADDAITASAATRSYAEIPGPQQLPLIGNAWRFAPLIGTYQYYYYPCVVDYYIPEAGKYKLF